MATIGNSEEVAQEVCGKGTGSKQLESGLFALTLMLRIQKGVRAELSMTTNLEDFEQWALVFDRLRLEWERQRIRKEERGRLQEE